MIEALEQQRSTREPPYEKLIKEPDFTADEKKYPDKVLGLSYKATPEQLRRRHRELTLRYHPDRTEGDASIMQKINVARDAFIEMRPKNLDTVLEEELQTDGRSLYELSASGAADAEFVARERYLREEITRQKNHLDGLSRAMSAEVGLPKDHPKEWTEFYTRTQDLSQRIENLRAELEARPPKKILHPDDGTFSPLYDQALAVYARFDRNR